MRSGYVYFVRPVVDNAPVKIGFSCSPNRRIATMGYWVPFPLEIVAQIAGDEELEGRFHRRLIDSHSHYEWFHWTEDVASVVNSVRSGLFDVSSLPEYGGAIRFLIRDNQREQAA